MAAFTDQFERRDPLTFNAHGVPNMWPRQLAWEARQLVAGRTTADLTAVARAIDQIIVARALATIARGPRSLMDFHAAPPMAGGLLTPTTSSPEAVSEVREEEGDLNLFRDAGSHRVLLGDPAMGALAVEEWEAYAVITLWRLVDYYDTIGSAMERDKNGRPVHTGAGEGAELVRLKRGYAAVRSATTPVIEAAAACMLGTESRHRHKMIAAVNSENERLAVKLQEFEQADRSRQQLARAAARQASTARWASIDEHKRRAIELASSRPFKTRAEAARFAADRLYKTDDETYTFETVDRWLRDAGWKSAS